MTKRSRANVLAFALNAGAVVLLLFDAGDADIFGLAVPIWLVASATLVVGRAVSPRFARTRHSISLGGCWRC